MQSLTIDPPAPLLIPPDRPLAVALVGCGGTGSHLAQALARLMSHARDGGAPPIHLTLVDGDTVEPKNVGRQLFGPADVGRNKAQVLAARLSAGLGLVIDAIPRMADGHLMTDLGLTQHGRERPYRVLVGAVDGPAGRRVLAHALRQRWADLWVDCGNHEHDGQVCAGTTLSERELAGAFAIPGLCAAVPAPAFQLPALLADPPAALAPVDCAAAVQANAQALQINAVIAQVAGQYLAEIALGRRLSVFQTWVDLRGLSMRSLPITARQVAELTGLPLATLTQTTKGKAA